MKRYAALRQTAEYQRLQASESRRADWKNWGPYVSDRAWGTVREDYSNDGNAWAYFPHDHARSRAYRWNEDGLGGICNRFQNLCLALAFWNEQDFILKERLFGLTGMEGNHGEDVKEYYFYLDSTPTHSYMKMLYKYPQAAFPYQKLIEENAQRSKHDPEYELIDALKAEFLQNRYFDIFIEYAKADQNDLLCRITAYNRADTPAPLHILPHLWFRNNWSWGYNAERPTLRQHENYVHAHERHIGNFYWYVRGQVEFLFTENDTNFERLFHQPNPTPYVKDGIHQAVVNGNRAAVNPARTGTKCAAHSQAMIPAHGSHTVEIRLTPRQIENPFEDFESIFDQRVQEANEFYACLQPEKISPEAANVQRQAFAGLLWSKQFYHLAVDLWQDGDPAFPPPPAHRKNIRNKKWRHLYNLDVISMPDKWEYPWYAAWDLAFHMLPLALVDPEWAKRQLILMLREWYMHPNGQIPAYEWAFDDVNPPVHAWAVWRVYKITRDVTGHADVAFLARAFQKLMLNFTWWVNRKDYDGNDVFGGGFLGLDNIGVFDRSAPLPNGGHIEQADGTAWMGMYCLNMLAIALELAMHDPSYEDVATKFFEHFIRIANAIYDMGDGVGLWDERDGFFYDQIHTPDNNHDVLRVRSFVGLIPLFAVETIEPNMLEKLPNFRKRLEWFTRYRPQLVKNIASLTQPGQQERRLLALADQTKLTRILARMLDENEFLSPYGLRSLSRYHLEHPYVYYVGRNPSIVRYEPAESTSSMFGGNSNWRGPIWFPVNFLMIESLQKYHHYYGDDFQVALPTHTSNPTSLSQVANDLSQRLTQLFLQNDKGERAFWGGYQHFQHDPHWRDYILFYEFFHGDNGAGIGASHQTGWTALVAKLLQQI